MAGIGAGIFWGRWRRFGGCSSSSLGLGPRNGVIGRAEVGGTVGLNVGATGAGAGLGPGTAATEGNNDPLSRLRTGMKTGSLTAG